MLTLARYALKGPYYAAAVVAVLAILSVYLLLISRGLPLATLPAIILSVIAISLVGLIILTQGIESGLKAIVISILGITAIAAMLIQKPGLGISIGLVQWLPIIILAQTLRSSKSLVLTILAGLAITMIAIIVQFSFWPEIDEEFLPFAKQFASFLAQNQILDGELAEQYSRSLANQYELLLVPFLYLLFIGILFLSRRTQARLANSDGFKREFLSIELGKPVAIVGLTIFLFNIWLDQDWITSVTKAVMLTFLFQGIAVIHWLLVWKNLPAFYIGMYYAFLLIIPGVAMISVIMGVIDNWLNFRKRGDTENTSG